MTTDFPTAPSAYGLNGPSANVTVEKSIHASHTEILTPPYLVLCFLIGFGTALVVWLMCLPMAERQLIVDRTLNVLTLLLAQPGLYLSDWFATRRKCAWPDRVALSLATFFGLVILLPAYVSTWLTPVLNL